ncbi:MAG: RloB family protein [Treponema sp.]|nr:RloB family protein [Treponema sp.]
MNKKRNPGSPRKMKPVFLVFCEGETEEAYISLLRQKYRWLPLKVVSRITGQAITSGIINKYVKAEQIGPNDPITTFLMYDLDTEKILEKLKNCKGSIILTSNPAIELWFLLHNIEQNAAISTDNCINKLKNVSPAWTNYTKGLLSDKQKEILWDNRGIASTRAKRLSESKNPSSLVYRLIEKMECV